MERTEEWGYVVGVWLLGDKAGCLLGREEKGKRSVRAGGALFNTQLISVTAQRGGGVRGINRTNPISFSPRRSATVLSAIRSTLVALRNAAVSRFSSVG